MRSASMAWLFETAGMECYLLRNGYKSFRQFVLSSFDLDLPFIVIGGLTGSGKTAALKALSEAGEQILDLEALAHHKGSAFGNLGEKGQYSNEHFENKICWDLLPLDKGRTIWVEDESRSIGKNTLPAGIYYQIRSAPVIFLDIPRKDRVERLVEDYALFPKDEIIDSIMKISQRLGGEMTSKAKEAMVRDRYASAAEIVLHYYDKTYRYGLGRRDQHTIFNLPIGDKSDSASVATQILSFARTFSKHLDYR